MKCGGKKPYSGIGIKVLPVSSWTYSAKFRSGPNRIVSASNDFMTSTAFALVQQTSQLALAVARVFTYRTTGAFGCCVFWRLISSTVSICAIGHLAPKVGRRTFLLGFRIA